MTLQHRHVFPGYVGPASRNEKWWHPVNEVHTKYPTAHEVILETREHTVKPRGARKSVTPVYSFNEYGEPVIPAPLTEGEAFMRAVEAALEEGAKTEAVAEATTVLELAAAITADADARMKARGITPSRR